MYPLLTAKDVSEVLRVSPRKFEQMVKDGEAPRHILIGRQRRWQVEDVQNWVDARFEPAPEFDSEGDESSV